MNFRFFIFLVALWGAVFPSVMRADIAPNPLSGGISLETTGRESTDIALRHNTVKIVVTPTRCITRAFFRLHNLGAATKLEVGFPLRYQGESPDFQLFINDKPVTFRDQVENYVTPIGQPRPRHWKAWDMSFPEGETHLVEVRYSNPPAEDYVDEMGYYGRYPIYRHKIETDEDYDLADFGYGKSQMLSDWVKVKTMRYILVSGSYWKGPIERCRVEADISALPTDGIIRVSPIPASFSAQKIVWQWSDIEPANNVRFTFMGASPQKEIIPYLRKILQSKPKDEAAKETLWMMERDFAVAGRLSNF